VSSYEMEMEDFMIDLRARWPWSRSRTKTSAR
jgi:hypothetical protein